MNKWTENEIQYLKDNYDKFSSKEIALRLNRSYTSVCKKASNLKITYHLNGINPSFTFKFTTCKQTAKDKNLLFELKFNEFIKLILQNCYYCNQQPEYFNCYKRNKKHQPYSEKTILSADCYINGIDRIDVNSGYILKNCVPCCKQCNYAKLDYSQVEFLDWAKRLSEFQNWN